MIIKQKDIIVEPINEKAFKHYKCFTKNNTPIVCFNFYKHYEVAKSKSEKILFVDFAENYYKGKTSLSIICKDIKIQDVDFSDQEEVERLSSLYNLYYSVMDFNNQDNYHIYDSVEEIIKSSLDKSNYGTLILVSNNEDYKVVEELQLTHLVSDLPLKNGQNVVVANPKSITSIKDAEGYENIIFLSKNYDNEHLYFSQKFNVYEPKNKHNHSIKLSKDRQVFAKCYNLINNFAGLKSNDVIDFATKLSLKSAEISASQILFCLIVFMELNFIEFDEILNSIKICKAKKMELSSSKFYNVVE